MPESIGLDVEDVDLFQFVDVSFKIRVKLVDTVSGTVKTGQPSSIKVLLGFEGNTTADTRCREHHPHLLEVVSNTGIQDNGCGVIEVKITDVSMNHDHQRFVVYLEAYRTHGENNILLAATNPITCVRHKLLISENNSQPYIWYKDEGAKDKCIKVLVKLVDSNKNVVKDRNVPLSVSLVYSSGQTVQPTTVLSIFNDKDKPLGVTSNGTELVKFRVNEVSRNHRKQLFHLLVAPDVTQDASLGDISPATSVAFEVKSKRTSDARKEHATLRGDEDDSTDAIPLPQSRLNELSSVQPLKRMKLDSMITAASAAAPAAPANPVTATPAIQTFGLGAMSASTGNAKPDSSRAGMYDFKGLDSGGRNLTSAAVNGMSGAPSSLAGMRSMMGLNGMGVGGLYPNAMGLRDDLGDELSYEIPFKAIYSLAEWTNVAVNALSAANHLLNSLDNHDPYNSNSIEVQQSIVQLVETYPGRAHSCLQYLQQFLALQEQRAVQQLQLLAMMQQEQQSFRLQLDSLIPQRGTGTTPTNTGNLSNMLGANRVNGGLQLGTNGLQGMGSNMLGSSGSGLQGGLNLSFQQQQVAAAAHQAAQQQQQLMNAANLLSRGMRRDPSGNTFNLPGMGNGIAPTNSMRVGSNNDIGNGLMNSAASINSLSNRCTQVPSLQQQQLQSLQHLAAAAIVDLNSNTGSSSGSTTTGIATTPSGSSVHNNTTDENNSNNFDSSVTNIFGKRIFLVTENELLGLPAFSSASGSSADMALVGFYLDDTNGLNNSLKDQVDELGWQYRTIQEINAFNDPNRSQALSKMMLELWKDPNNRQDGICFDVNAYDGNLIAMKKSIGLILTELEENEVSNTHFVTI